MTDIVLSRPAYSGGSTARMEKADLGKWLELFGVKKRIQLYCHGDWDVSIDDLIWLLAEGRKKALDVSVCLFPDEIKKLRSILDSQQKVELVLRHGEEPVGLGGLPAETKAAVFLPLPEPSGIPSCLEQALKHFPEPEQVTLGVGWADRLSGPAPVEEGEEAAWARSILEIAEFLALHNERVEKKVRLEFACGLKLCLLEQEQLGELVNAYVRWPIATCPRPLVVWPDGEVQPCVRLRLPEAMYPQAMADPDEVAVAAEQWLAPYAGLCYDSPGLNCRSLKVKSCATGCLQHSVEQWGR